MAIGRLALIIFALTGTDTTGLSVDPVFIRLDGPDARMQVVVTGHGADGQPVDLTHDRATRLQILDTHIASTDGAIAIRAVADGSTVLQIETALGSIAVPITVQNGDGRRPVRFLSEIVPIFSKLGCNSGACHGKTSGQNGFRLSLLGFEPKLDYESLTREARGRRVFPAAPAESLVLKKPTTRLPHGGGKRLEIDSPEFRTLARWIRQGMPFEPTREPALIGLEARPAARRGGRRVATGPCRGARFGDGSESDVTRLADYRTTDLDLLAVDARGRAETRAGVGEAAVVVRFGGRVATVRITVPRTVADAPKAASVRNESGRSVRQRRAGRATAHAEGPPSDDATFARRSSLDVCGVLPDPADVAALESDADRDKRAKWVARLCDRPEYADRMATTWSALLRNQRTLGDLSKPGTFALHDWIREAFAENRPYVAIVAALLTATGDGAVNPPVVWYRQGTTAEEKADDVAQLFLGVRLQCARCHHHPLERWEPDDYYGFAAFFSRIGRKAGPDPVTPRVFVLPSGVAIDPTTGRALLAHASSARPSRLTSAPTAIPAPCWSNGCDARTTPISPARLSTGPGNASSAAVWSSQRMTSARATRPAFPVCSTPWPTTSWLTASTSSS